MSSVLVIGDTHCPVMRDGYVDFLLHIADRWSCDRVIHIGDLVDHCALSFHKKKPHLKNATTEYGKAKEQCWELWEAFPEVDWLVGNHDALPYRWCEEVGLDEDMMKDPVSMFEMDGWQWHPRYGQVVIDDVIYQHGDRGKGGRMAALNNAKSEFASVVQGHHHQQAGVEFFCNLKDRVFGMQVGCGVDHEAAAMEYGQKYTQKPILGCGVVLDGETPIFEPMRL